MMVRTYGLTHVALAVADPERSFAFSQAAFAAATSRALSCVSQVKPSPIVLMVT